GSFEGYLNGTKWHLKRLLNKKRQSSFISSSVDTRGVTIKEPVWIEDDVKIGSKSNIGPYTIVKRGTSIGQNCVIRDSVLLEKSHLKDDICVYHSIVGELTNVEKGAEIDGSIVGPGSEVRKKAQIYGGTRTSPNMVVLRDEKIPRTFEPDLEGAFYFHDKDGLYTGHMARNPLDLIELLPKVSTDSLELHKERGDLDRWLGRSVPNDNFTKRFSEIRDLSVENYRKRLTEIIAKYS
ncbi:MAG: hypothetical protein ACE5KG_00750, partial [Nitrososphaerales archaeon]